jgi:integrase
MPALPYSGGNLASWESSVGWRTLVSGWPWNGQQLEKRGKRVQRGAKIEEERPFTDDEARKLLYSPFPLKQSEWEEQIRDALRISLLSGMRLAEVVTLWIEEVHDGVFDIQQGKTDAAARKVPIHPDLAEIVERRTRGKAPELAPISTGQSGMNMEAQAYA